MTIKQVVYESTGIGKVGYSGSTEVYLMPEVEINYGYLYNWYVVDNILGISNTGWSAPTNTEINTLRNYLDPGSSATVNDAGARMKESGTIWWSSPNTGAINDVGFNARGNGRRTGSIGSFIILNEVSDIWTKTDYNGSSAYIGNLVYDSIKFSTNNVSEYDYGLCVRLIKDSTSLSHGESGFYCGNDGTVYRTICIGTQEWLADNLAETKYHDGSLIPIETVDATWAALTTGARCVYDNNEDYR